MTRASSVPRAEGDFLGVGTFPVRTSVRQPTGAVHLRATYRFSSPGTYFQVVRVTSQHDGDANAPYGLFQNLARVRVVVH